MALIFVDSKTGSIRPFKKASPAPKADFRKILEQLAATGRDHREVFNAFATLSACALACETREAEYFEEIKRWDAECLNLFATAFAALIDEMESKPFEDVLGPHYMQWALSKASAKSGGEFYTPGSLCELLAKVLATPDGIKETIAANGVCSVLEPTCGSGGMILALAKSLVDSGNGGLIRKLRVTATDISLTACNMCYVNMALWGIPATVQHGNWSSREVWKSWRNIHPLIG